MEITYEDGLRLSELYGQLAQMNVQMDNYLIEALPWIIIGGIALAVASAILIWIIRGAFDELFYLGEEQLLLVTIVTGLIMLVLSVTVIVLFYKVGQIDLEANIANVQAQIDAIEMKYAEKV